MTTRYAASVQTRGQAGGGRDWAAAAKAKIVRRLKEMNDRAPSVTLNIADSPETARGWLYVDEVYSTIPDVVYPWDPAVVRAIREFCPDAVPITIKSIWRSSILEEGGTRTMSIVRHGIARFIRDPVCEPHHFQCETPSSPYVWGVHIPRPNYIEVNWHNRHDRPLGRDLPGTYLPFNWELYHCLRATYYDSLSPADVRASLDAHERRHQRRRQQLEDEAAYRSRDFERYAQKKMDQVSELEWKEHLLGDNPAPTRPTFVVPELPSNSPSNSP